jgi:hypothetical protein
LFIIGMNQPNYEQLMAKLERLQRDRQKESSRTKSQKREGQGGLSPPSKLREIRQHENGILTDR